jgi:hypothetical protein
MLAILLHKLNPLIEFLVKQSVPFCSLPFDFGYCG